MPEKILSDIHRYWLDCRGQRPMPSRADIDPADIPQLLPYLLLTDLLDDGRYRFRLVGTEVERSFGAPMTGRTLEELMSGDYLAFMRSLYRKVIAEKRAIYSTSRYSGADGDSPLFTKRVMMPLSSDGLVVDMVISAQVFLRVSALDDRTAQALLRSVGYESEDEENLQAVT